MNNKGDILSRMESMVSGNGVDIDTIQKYIDERVYESNMNMLNIILEKNVDAGVNYCKKAIEDNNRINMYPHMYSLNIEVISNIIREYSQNKIVDENILAEKLSNFDNLYNIFRELRS